MLSSSDTVPIVSLALVSGLPILYFATGLCYQVGMFSRGIFEVLRRAEQRDLTHILDVDAETYVLDYSGVYAGAVSLLGDYIIVSQGVLDRLSEEEIAVIMAHEEGHVKHGDTTIGVVVIVLSILVLTGKNVLYGVLDFRSREFRADQYAASRLDDPQQVVDTLDSLQQIRADETSRKLPSVTPTLLPIDSEETTADSGAILQRWFGFYFGEFAMSQVHPGLDERKQRLK